MWGNVKNKPTIFPVEAHTHDDRYYTESEMDGKLNSKVNNNEAGANGLFSKLTTSWTATPTDNTYFIRQDTGGGDSFGRVKFSTLWNYIKGKADGTYQPKGSYAVSGHTHDDRYYTESEVNSKLAGKSNTDHTHNTSSIIGGNVNYAGYAGPIESAHIDVLRANRLAFLPASGIKVEYSVDGGVTWVDYGATDAQKASLFAMRMGSATQFYTGKHTKKEECTTKDQLRITITPVDRYTSVNMLYLWVSVAGTSATVNISRSTIGAKEIFTDVRTDVPISGWSGPNEIRFSQGTFGGGSTQTSNQYAYRFTFKNKADSKGSVCVMDVRMYGPSAWSVPNSMMEKDHLYNWDADKNAFFPAQVTATKFNGSATSAETATKLSSSAGSNTQPVYFSGGKPVAIGYTISSSVPANAKFTDTTYGVATSSSNGLMSSDDKTKMDGFSKIVSIQKQIKMTTDWQDTGIAGNNLETGTYVVQVSGFNPSYTGLYSEIYSGIMTWYSSNTNDRNSSEIFLHNAGHADNNNAIYLRTLRTAGNNSLKLQISCKVAATGTDSLTFKFRRLI